MQKNQLRGLVESGEPVVIVVLSQKGLEKAFVFYEQENAEALEAGNQLLARVSLQLALVDNAIRRSPGEPAEAVEQELQGQQVKVVNQ